MEGSGNSPYRYELVETESVKDTPNLLPNLVRGGGGGGGFDQIKVNYLNLHFLQKKNKSTC